jgi:hypothetical protein
MAWMASCVHWLPLVEDRAPSLPFVSCTHRYSGQGCTATFLLRFHGVTTFLLCTSRRTTQKEYARGEVHEKRAECLFSLLKPYLQVFRGVSKFNLPGYVGFLQCLRNFRQQNAFGQAELILQAALAPALARRAKKGEVVTCFDPFDLLQTAIN